MITFFFSAMTLSQGPFETLKGKSADNEEAWKQRRTYTKASLTETTKTLPAWESLGELT
jgi:hypothetical protein